jgi:hypothetical protein
MNDSRLRRAAQWFGVASLPVKIICLVAAALVLSGGVWGLVTIKDKIGDAWEHHLEAKYDRKQAADAERIGQLEQANAKLIEEMKVEMAKGDMKAQEADALRGELEKYGKAAKEAAAKQGEAVKTYESEKLGIAVNASSFERCQDLCSERARLGYACKPGYCDRYAGQ